MTFVRKSRLGLIAIIALVFATTVHSQGNNGRGKCMQPYGISFYKVVAGHEDEWLELFMEWHYPILQYALQQGTLVDFRMYVPDGHGGEPWTFANSYLSPDGQSGASAGMDRRQLIEHLFGERMDAYVAGEKRRWSLTEKHWDTNFVELDQSESPLSLYLPSRGGCGKP